MTSELIEKLNSLTSAVIEHRLKVNSQKQSTLEELTRSTATFYKEVFDRYLPLLKNTQKIYNSMTQYEVHTEYGNFSMGLTATGFFSSLAGWGAYSFGSLCMCYRNEKGLIDLRNKEGLLKLRDFLNNVDWADFDKQITEQAVKLFGRYEEETLKEEL